MVQYGSGFPNHLHLLRAILRECTYLPDSAARQYVWESSVSQFRRYLARQDENSVDQKAEKVIPRKVTLHWILENEQNPGQISKEQESGEQKSRDQVDRQIQLLDRARRQLSLLRRANEGYIRPLEKVLLQTYGRTGKRRYHLLGRILKDEFSQARGDKEELPNIVKYSHDWKPPAIIEAIAESQFIRRGLYDRTVRSKQIIFTRKGSIPRENLWGRPLPRRRAMNMTRKWYAKIIDRILPPLPKPEKERLGALIRRPPRMHELPRRRKRVGDWGEVEDSLLSANLLVKGPPKSHTFAKYAKGRPHKITPRLLRPIWAKIYAHTPDVEWDAEQNKWLVTWPEPPQEKPSFTTETSEQTDLLFGQAGHQAIPP